MCETELPSQYSINTQTVKSLGSSPAGLVPVPVAGTGLPTPCDWHLKPWSHQHLQVFHSTLL